MTGEQHNDAGQSRVPTSTPAELRRHWEQPAGPFGLVVATLMYTGAATFVSPVDCEGAVPTLVSSALWLGYVTLPIAMVWMLAMLVRGVPNAEGVRARGPVIIWAVSSVPIAIIWLVSVLGAGFSC